MYVLFQPIGIAGGLQSVALFSRDDIHLFVTVFSIRLASNAIFCRCS